MPAKSPAKFTAQSIRHQRAVAHESTCGVYDGAHLPSALEVRMVPGKGRALFALAQFTPGEIVLHIHGQVIDDRNYGSLYCMDLGGNRVLEPDMPGGLANHSCNPNCELIQIDENTMGLQAIVNIEPDREITYDYGWPAYLGDGFAPVRCHCGAPQCRKWIVAADELKSLLSTIKRKRSKLKRSKSKQSKRRKSK